MILLTGTGGFIGSHLLRVIRSLTPDDEIAVLKSSSGDYSRPSLMVQEKSSDAAGLKSLPITHVIHAGAFTPKDRLQSLDWHSCNGNITFTARLLDVLPPSVESLVFLSTLDVYGLPECEITEDSAVNPLNLYAHSKSYCERMISSWAVAEKKTAQLLRIGHIYGPGEEAYQKLMPVTIRKCLEGVSPEIWGDGLDRRTFLYIDDAVRSILAASRLATSAGVINVAGNEAYSVRSIVEKIISLAKPDLSIVHHASNTPRRDLVFDNSKMKKHLLSEFTPLDAGLQVEVEHMKRSMNP